MALPSAAKTGRRKRERRTNRPCSSWDDELEEEARLAAQGDYLQSGEKIKARRVKS